jgi:hypothetical protein
LPTLRRDAPVAALSALIATSHRADFAIVEFSVMSNHLHVLNNAQHHGYAIDAFDPYSSAAWFDGWATPPPAPERSDPCAPPRTWLLAVGWKRRGLLALAVRQIAIWNDDLPTRAML